MRKAVAATLALLTVAVGLAAQSPAPPPTERPGVTTVASRNPPRLDALLELGGIGSERTPRVRFEWRSMPGATAYLLIGALTDRQTWLVRTTEHRVTSANAAEWTATRIRYETPLNPGLYSWKLVALYPPGSEGDFASPTVASFEVH
jgi:hypothetical protein